MDAALLLRSRTRYLWALYALAAVWALRGALLPATHEDADVFIGVAAGIVSVLLLDADSRARGQALPAKWLLAFAWPVALPGYVVATRGARGVWIVVKHGVLLYAVWIAATMCTRLVAFGNLRGPNG